VIDDDVIGIKKRFVAYKNQNSQVTNYQVNLQPMRDVSRGPNYLSCQEFNKWKWAEDWNV